MQSSPLDAGQKSRRGRHTTALRIISIAIIVATISGMVYLASTGGPRERFTEFYVLGQDGRAEDYPRVGRVGVPATVVVGIVNHEQEPATYRLSITMSGEEVQSVGPIVLPAEAKWENAVSFSPKKVGPGQRVDLLLHKGTGTKPYLALNLTMAVSG